MAREQRRYDEGLRGELAPYEQQLTELERFRRMPGIDPTLKMRIENYQEELDKAIGRAFEPISVDQYKQELELLSVEFVNRGVTVEDPESLTNLVKEELERREVK